MTTTCPTCKREYNTIVSGVSCPLCAWLARPTVAELEQEAANQRYSEAGWRMSGTNYGNVSDRVGR